MHSKRSKGRHEEKYLGLVGIITPFEGIFYCRLRASTVQSPSCVPLSDRCDYVFGQNPQGRVKRARAFVPFFQTFSVFACNTQVRYKYICFSVFDEREQACRTCYVYGETVTSPLDEKNITRRACIALRHRAYN